VGKTTIAMGVSRSSKKKFAEPAGTAKLGCAEKSDERSAVIKGALTKHARVR
jgi:hypothetical protein